ncbi:benenodin family lasso peptide [Sphingomonas colocasiae]|uniref:Benenodin family lasso peptide n=1 Tax=Sphingomonas colocasiae TaxID=1848973 RepID=A0ABS7PZB4_9SPHN|nr:benenodin family lasso peptide [Sphingomonas colocasiae]MBY8823321.1 benenodin family lasso peptide [Sphingomonas colocasiae]MBY8826456.1 benenodin family lasso peptide [Sphingomonas colocasiae]
MNRQTETLDSVTLDLGVASLETRGFGKGQRDVPDEQDPASGLSDD